MVERKLNLDIEKSVEELEGAAKEARLRAINKKEKFVKNSRRGVSDQKIERELEQRKAHSLLRRWKIIFALFLIFSIFMIIIMGSVLFSYYKTGTQRQEWIAQNYTKNYISSVVHLTNGLNNSFINILNFSGVSDKNVQNFIIIKDEKCNPNILCKYIGYVQEYDLSTLINKDFLLDKRVVNCYDTSNCVSNFTYLERLEESEELFSRQQIRIKKDEENNLNIYDEHNIFIAKIEGKYVGGIKVLDIWFKFD